MMPIVSRLIGISVFGSIVLVAIALTGLLAVFTLLDQIGDLDQRYTFWAALLYVGLSVPRLFYETLPYACLLYTSPSPRDATLSRMPSSA